ncbi:MAG: outer membrane protein assembly factor BamB family protein [Planctomycetota bacterium]
MKQLPVLVFSVIFLVTLVSVDVCGDTASNYWPTWRGPDATGVSAKGDPPVKWSETENIKWKIKLPGEGLSSPVIWDDKIFFQAAIETQEKGTNTDTEQRFNVHKFDLVCVDKNTGKILWQETVSKEVPYESHHASSSFASYSPVTDDKSVWVGFGGHGLHCYDMKGNHKWSADLGKISTEDEIGGASSPALAGDAVIVVMDHMGDSSITSVNKDIGEIIWRKERDEETGWATPLAVEVDNQKQVVTSSDKLVRTYNVKTGDLIWYCEGQTMNTIPSPVYGFGKVFCTSGFQGNIMQAIELGHTGDLTGSDAIIWEIDKNTPYIPSPLLFDEKIYICHGNRPVISCYNAETGETVFERQKLEELKEVYASPVGAADRVYIVGRNGKTAVLKHDEEFQILAVNTLDDKFDASPAIAGDELFLKGKTHLYCIAKR